MNREFPIRVLQVVAKMERSGYESRIMDIYRNLDRDKVQYDFYTHRKEKGDFDDEIISLGGNIYYNDAINPIHFLKYLKDLNQFFKNHHYDIVHAHLNSYCAWVLFAAKHNGVKVRIAHSRNSGFDPGWKTFFKRISKLFVNIPPTHKFACSKNAGVWLFGRKVLNDKNFKVIPNAFNCDRFSYDPEMRRRIREELDIGDEIAVVHIGRLTSQKNHPMILNIFLEFKKNHSNARLYLFGDGELKQEIYKMVKEMSLIESVFFMGNRSDVYRYLNAMDIMLFPSKYEGFGTVAIEAQCNGLAILASDVLPEETKLTPIIKYKSLRALPGEWAEEMDRMIVEMARKDYSETVKSAGYDMKVNALKMQAFYINSIK